MSPSGEELRRIRGDGWGMKHALPFLRSPMLASGMIYEEVGRSASTSKGRPTRAGRMLSTASLNTARYASTVASSLAVFCSTATKVGVTQLFSLAERRRVLLEREVKGERRIMLISSVFTIFLYSR